MKAGRKAIYANVEVKKLLVKLLKTAVEPLAQAASANIDEVVLCSIPSAVWMLREPSNVPVPSISEQTCILPELHLTASDMTMVVQGPGEQLAFHT